MLSVTSCESFDPASNLIGTWNLSSIATNNKTTESNTFVKAVEQIKSTTTISFNENKTFTGKIWGDTAYGVWNINREKMILTIFDESLNLKIKTKLIYNSDTTISLIEKHDSISVKMDFTKITNYAYQNN